MQPTDISSRIEYAEKVIKASYERPVVAVFWASWCAPCKLLKPKLDTLQKQYDFPLVRFSVEEDLEFAKELRVRNVPTVIVINRGFELTRFAGDKTLNDLENALMRAGVFQMSLL